MPRYLLAVLVAFDVMLNALTGGRPYQTLSARIGENIKRGGWASHVPWPAWLKAHFLGAVFVTVV